MKIAPGIRGIRKTLAENAGNCRVWVMREEVGPDGIEADQVGFTDATINTIRTTYKNFTLVNVTGNGLFFKKEI